ncbi:Set1/Ash2 histone methyltransferase complex subunit ASH2 [Nymphon striatum]|nr:Set1/Ash2 histone methyltransferase complex subunit ASH2 [Nymphon striatum]
MVGYPIKTTNSLSSSFILQLYLSSLPGNAGYLASCLYNLYYLILYLCNAYSFQLVILLERVWSIKLINTSSKSFKNSKLPKCLYLRPVDSVTVSSEYVLHFSGDKRNFTSVELQCLTCFKWFHDFCIKDCPALSSIKTVPFMTNYHFTCKSCSGTENEIIVLKQANFTQMCITAIANLMLQHQERERTMFSKETEIIRYIEKNWECLTTMPRRVKQTWHATVLKNLKDDAIFTCEEKYNANGDVSLLFGLVLQDLNKIGPNYENLPKGNPKDGIGGISSQLMYFYYSDLTLAKLPPHGYPLEHPFNKDGYRYILAEPDPHAPYRQEFDESLDWAGKPIPGFLYRALLPVNPLLALHDREGQIFLSKFTTIYTTYFKAPQLKISDDRLNVVGEKGYSMVRASTGVQKGTWYYECVIDEMPADSTTRMGWCLPLGNLQAPLGYDHFSYSYRARKGTCFHQSKGKRYGDGYSEGDVIGFLINLPPEKDQTYLPITYKDKPLVKFKSHLYYEEKDEVQSAIKNLKPHPGSLIKFYKNGVCQGVAWDDINAGTYYPAASLYKGASVTFNFGPKFKFEPKEKAFKGINEAAHENIIHQTVADLIYLVENEGNLQLSSYYT